MAFKAVEPALLLNPSATAMSALPLAEALICAPDAISISESAVGPSFRIITLLPVIEALAANVISPEVRLVLPVPSFKMISTSPEPAARFLEAASEMTALPESRCASTTPLAVVSFA